MKVQLPLSARDQELLSQAASLFSQGRYDRTIALAAELGARHPRLQLVHKLHGCALQLAGRSEEAVAALRIAVRLAPSDAQAWSNLGNALASCGLFEDALDAHRRALVLQPVSSAFNHNLGCVLLQVGQRAEALDHFWRAFDFAPSDAELARLCRELLAELGDLDRAALFCRVNLERLPADAGAAAMLGGIVLQQGLIDEALVLLDAAVKSVPGDAVAWSNLSVALRGAGRFQDAVEAGLRAASLAPEWAQACNNAAVALRDAGQLMQARTMLLRAIECDPAFPDPYYNLGCTSADLGDNETAREALIEAIKREPRIDWMLQAAHACRQLADWDGAELIEAAFFQQFGEGLQSQAHVLPSPFAYLATPGTGPVDQRVVAEHFAAQYVARVAVARAGAASARGPLRLGLLSADFRDHATAHLLVGVLEAMDPARFHLIAYDYGPRATEGDEYRRRLQSAILRWVDVAPMSDIDAARRLQSDGVDIAIDLKGWTQGYRAGILAYRPAPIQMQWLGFPGTMGAPWIDYVIADAVVIPPGMEGGCSEQVLRLPACYQPNDRLRVIGQTPDRESLGFPESAVVLAGFHQYYKITRETFALWMRVLGQCPDAVLWLLDGPESAKAVFLREAAAAGIERKRLVWAPRVPAAEHLGRLGQADLALDAFPVNAHTTASDSLWAGVPQLAICGDTFVSRVSASILHAAGLPQLVANDETTYERLIVELIRNVEMRAMLRNQLRETRDKVALFDAEAFARYLGAGLEEAWQRHQRGLPVAHIDVAG